MRIPLVASLLLFLSGVVFGQSTQDPKERARAYLANGRYAEAITELQAPRRLLRDDAEARFWLAVSAYETNDLATAEATLQGLINKEEPEFPEVLLYLGRVYHAQHQFVLAAEYYKRYLRRLRSGDERRQMLIEAIRSCDLGKEFQYRPARIVAENLGPAVNTTGDEYGPIPSPSRSGLIYFTARRGGNSGGRRDASGRPDPQWGEYSSDLFQSRRQGGDWQSAEPLHYLLNSAQDEEFLGFAADGRSMYYARGRFGQRQYYVDPFQEEEQRQLNTLPLPVPIDPNRGDLTPYLLADTAVYFAANRPGGYGGLDLYRMAKRNGQWTAAENLGPEINTPFDETTPFLAPDGRTLYFSSNDSRRGIGGFDVLSSYYLPETDRWTRPENPGLPLNSAGDDTHFRLVTDGYTGFLSSSRKDGRGGMDLYIVYFQDYQEAADPAPPPIAVARPPIPEPVAPQPELAAPPTRTILPVTRPATPPSVAVRDLPAPGQTAAAAARESYTFRYERQLPTDAGNRTRLNRVLDRLLAQPTLELVITATTSSLASGVFHAGMERARIMGAFFTERGIAPQRLFLRGIPQPGEPESVSLHFAGTGVDGRTDLPVVTGPSAYDQPLVYKVQVVATQRPYQGRDLSAFPHPMIESIPDFAFNRYTLGAFTDAAAAKAYLEQLTAAGFRGAYVVAYIYGQRVAGPALDHWRTRFPDLANYLAGE